MTSFSATKIVNEGGFLPTFVGGFMPTLQIYHRIGSLLPLAENDHKFLQIYFIGQNEKELDQCCTIAKTKNRKIISELQKCFHMNNNLVNSFKTALKSCLILVMIRPDKTTVGEHKGRYNIPISNDIAIVMRGNVFESRDIVIEYRDAELKRVTETHCFYDALQYPWNVEDTLKIFFPIFGAKPRKNIFSVVTISDRFLCVLHEE